MPCGLEYICISLILGNIISEIISFFYIYFLYKLDEKKFINRTSNNSYYEKKILKITIPIGLTSFIRSGLSTIKQVLIPHSFQRKGFSTEKSLANYGFISGMAMPLVLFPNTIVLAFSSLLIPEFTEFNKRSEYLRMKRVSKKIIIYTLLFSITISIIILIFSKQLCYFMYKSLDVVIYVRLLAPLIPIMYLDSVVDAILKGLDQQVTVLKINILDSVTCILLICSLIPIYGIAGYIFIIYFSEILNFALSFYTFKQTLH